MLIPALVAGAVQLLIAWQVGTLRDPAALLFALSGVALPATLAYIAFRSTSDAEAHDNYAADGQRCGRCEYDLTGNTSGVCPECGWEIPHEPRRIESGRWAWWWRQWRIDYVSDWPRQLALSAALVAIFVMLIVYLAMCMRRIHILAEVPPAAVSLHFAINTVRLAAYGRRTGGKRAGNG